MVDCDLSMVGMVCVCVCVRACVLLDCHVLYQLANVFLSLISA